MLEGHVNIIIIVQLFVITIINLPIKIIIVVALLDYLFREVTVNLSSYLYCLYRSRTSLQ